MKRQGTKKDFVKPVPRMEPLHGLFSQELKHGYADALNDSGSAATEKMLGQNIFYIFGRKIDVSY